MSHCFRQFGDPSQRYLCYVMEICRMEKWKEEVMSEDR